MIDFDTWLANYKLPQVEFVAVFDKDSGTVISVGPSHAFVDQKHKISIDKELAEAIINSEIKIENCVVDINSNSIEIAEIKNINKIDDVLHRIPDKKYCNVTRPDIYLTYETKKQSLKIALSIEYGGTHRPSISVKKRNVIWDGETDMQFFITEYNDPNLLLQSVSVKINDLVGKSKIIKNIECKKFSVFTRRLFKNYIIEYK